MIGIWWYSLVFSLTPLLFLIETPSIWMPWTEIQVVLWRKSIWSFESWNLNYQRSNCYSGEMSASGRFRDFAAENCQLRVLIIWLNVSATKYKVRRWPKLFLLQSRREKCKSGKNDEKIFFASFSSSSRTNFSVPFRAPLKQQCGAKWICNLFKQPSLFLFPNPHSICFPLPPSRKCHSQMYKCSRYKQMLVKFVIMQWNESEPIQQEIFGDFLWPLPEVTFYDL